MCAVQIRQNFCFLSQKERWTCIRRENQLLLGKYPMIFFDCCHLGPTKSSPYCADQAAGSFSVIISLKRRVFLRKTKTVPVQYHLFRNTFINSFTFQAETKSVYWWRQFLVQSFHVGGRTDSWSSDTECWFSLSFQGNHWIVQYLLIYVFMVSGFNSCFCYCFKSSSSSDSRGRRIIGSPCVQGAH